MAQKLRVRKILTILISGKAGVGKTTLANILLEEVTKHTTLSVEIHPLAEPIKSLCRREFGWDGKKDENGRKLLQEIGSIGRDYNEDIWVNKVLNKIESGGHTGLNYPDVVICDDWRYPNERDVLKTAPLLDVVTIRVEAKNREVLRGTANENHISETSLPGDIIRMMYYDYNVDNAGSMRELEKQAKKILESLATKYFVKE